MKCHLGAAAAALFPLALFAQEQRLPQVSPAAAVTQRIGLSDVTISYHRPSVKGRKVWGGLVPYGQVWRTGANAATTIAFGEDVLVEGLPIAAGTYGLFTIPGEKEWTLLLKETKPGGSYRDASEALRVKLRPRAAGPEEALSFRFENVTTEKATVVLSWAKLEVPFVVRNKVDTHERVLAGFRERIAKKKAEDWEILTEAAEYCADFGIDREEAYRWLDQALAIKDSMFSRFIKGRLLEQEGKVKEAVAELERGVAVAGPEDEKEFIEEVRSMAATWRKRL